MLLLNLGVRLAAAVLQVPSDTIGACIPMMAPFPKSLEQMRRRQTVDEIMQVMSESSEDDHKFQSGPATYGEVTCVGARQLFHYMGLMDEKAPNTTTFMDLGSGCGKLVLQAGLEVQVPSFGVELDRQRHALAMQHLNNIKDDIGSQVHLECGDLFEFDITATTHVYVSSLCFTDDMIVRLSQKLATEAPSLKCIATLKKLSSSHFKSWEPQIEFIEMSWSKPLGCSVYLYNL